MNNKEKMAAIESWQKSEMHPLTCGNCRKALYPLINSANEVVLVCDCGLIQKYVPEVVYRRYKRIKEQKVKE